MTRILTLILALFALPVGAFTPQFVQVSPLAEVRHCGPAPRDAAGAIARSAAVIYAFRQMNPCPVTGLKTGACPRWALNHIKPLANGGCDAVSNLMWMPVEIKSCAHPWCVDRWERTYWTEPRGVIPPFTPASGASAP